MDQNKNNKERLELPSILYTNVRSINTTKKNDLECLVANYKPKIIALTETWLSNRNEDTANLANYNLFTVNRSNSRIGGGASLHIASTLNAKTVAKMESKTSSAVWVKITRKKAFPLLVETSVENSNYVIEQLTTTLTKLTTDH